jgi:uncharacterized membrane protein YeiB
MLSNIRFWAYAVLAVVALFFVVFTTGLISIIALGVAVVAAALAVRAAISTSGQTKDIIESTETAFTGAVDAVETASATAVDAASRAAHSAVDTAKSAVEQVEEAVKETVKGKKKR